MASTDKSKPAGDTKAAKPLSTQAKISDVGLTPAQRKAKAKEEKAARRAKVKETREEKPTLEPKLVKRPHRPSIGGRRPSIHNKEPVSTIPSMFSHIPIARRIPLSQTSKDVHPAVLAVGQQMASFALRDSMGRLRAMLEAFEAVISAYETPAGGSLSRHFIPHVLNDQIEYLAECRPLSFAMGNAIRRIKAKISSFGIDTPEDEAKQDLLELVESLLAERVTLAQLLIARSAVGMIERGDVVLTYGWHELVERALLQAGPGFKVVVVDDPFDPTGKKLAKTLTAAGITVTYMPHLGGLDEAVDAATLVMLGAEAFFANGAMYAPCGTNDVALAARDRGKAAVVLCETINFDRERVAVDALTYNEVDPNRCSADAFRLLFDVTRAENVTGIITENEAEHGVLTPAAVASILSRQDLTQG